MKRLFLSIQNLSGVGQKRFALYQKIGVLSPYDLLYYFPRDYRDYRDPVPVADTMHDTHAVIRVTITGKRRPIFARSGVQIFTADAQDAEGTPIAVKIFNNRFSFQALEIGRAYSMYGKISVSGERREISAPMLHREEDNPLEAVYPQTTGLTSAMIRTNVREALAIMDETPFETLPAPLRRRYHLLPLPRAMHGVHNPETMEQAEEARRRLAFEELLQMQLAMKLIRNRSARSSEYPMDPATDLQPYFGSLPFTPTSAQQNAIAEITADLCSGAPMNRLLQGDVGSGKTAVAAAACYFCAKNGAQCALMAPTEILAGQHAQTLSSFLEPLGISVCLLTGSLKAKEKKALYARIADGSVQVIVGTHAVFQKAVTYQRLALVITDEQHRFGVAQRAALAEKGGVPHKLVMSATPIPRTLALLLYGDLEVSVLDVMPSGRLPIQTYAVGGGMRRRVMNFLIKELEQGRQGYIVCPSIEEGESDLKAVTAYAEEAGKRYLPGWRLGILHGQMSPQEKEETMQRFRDGEIDVLICTTVVEVGVDVPNATVMLIEDAERFGLSQLHQLRGRVGRSSHQSYCILITEHVTEESRERLRLLSSTTDGFAVAEADLRLRGPGDFFGSMQHGLPPMKLASLTDPQMLHDVQEAAALLMEDDPELQSPEHHSLYLGILRVLERYGENGLN